jgi:hypothetical protein
LPSHVPAGCSVADEQLAGVHVVPTGKFRQLPAPSQVPSRPQVEGSVALHIVGSDGGEPAVSGMQNPSMPACPHEKQGIPEQSTLQQTPCEQKPESHSDGLFGSQEVPSAFFPHEPASTSHLCPFAQSSSLAHWVEHLAPTAHRYGAQDRACPAMHVPSGVQREAVTDCCATQLASVQTSPAAYFAQLPAPSQTPLKPQLATPWSVHFPRGFMPAGAGMHAPALPGSAHEKHVLLQSDLQQTLSLQ